MPQNRRIDVPLDLDLTPEDVYELESGHRFFRTAGAPPDLGQAWRAIGQALTVEHARLLPGSRPHGWWRYTFQSLERRQQVSGPVHTMLAVGSTITPSFFYGRPATHAAQDQHCLFECQHVYLARHKLFTPDEQRLAASPAWICAACAYTGGFGEVHLSFQEVQRWWETAFHA